MACCKHINGGSVVRGAVFVYFLLRLRLKSNHESVATFLAGRPDDQLLDFDRFLDKICTSTLLCLEAILVAKCGSEDYLALAKRFVEWNSKAERLRKRIEFFVKNA